MRKALLLVALTALALPAAASAHATLTKTEPEYGTRVERAPKVVRLFAQQGCQKLRQGWITASPVKRSQRQA